MCYTIRYLMHCDILLSLSILMNKLLHISPLGAHWLLCSFVMFVSFVYTSLFSDTTRRLGERIVHGVTKSQTQLSTSTRIQLFGNSKKNAFRGKVQNDWPTAFKKR